MNHLLCGFSLEIEQRCVRTQRIAQPHILRCASGGRSGQATAFLQMAGVECTMAAAGQACKQGLGKAAHRGFGRAATGRVRKKLNAISYAIAAG